MRKFLFIVTLLLSLSSYAQTKKTQPATNSKTAYTEKQAMQYMRDYYDFYKSDKKYRVLDARKVSSNVFHVKVEEAYTIFLGYMFLLFCLMVNTKSNITMDCFKG